MASVAIWQAIVEPLVSEKAAIKKFLKVGARRRDSLSSREV